MNDNQSQSSNRLQWSQSQRELLDKNKTILAQIENEVTLLANQGSSTVELRSLINSLKNTLSEFDSSFFIVTTIGMLKAGKSTLVNLLARSGLASPTGFGFDTTLRPALITQADNDKGEIQIWFKADNNKSETENALDEVFAVIRGTRDETSMARFEERSLNDENLKNALCKKTFEDKSNMLHTEPLLVVVKVPPAADALLSDKIAILDTPGLDSGIAEWSLDKDNCYKWILRRSDLILFLQSSVAPLNETAATILKEIQKNDRGAPIWLVHNIMEAKHWLKKEDIEQESLDQQKMANAIFKKTVGEKFSSFQANLGKAYSAILKPEQISGMQIPNLLKESSFESLESSVKKSISHSAEQIRKQTCCKQAWDSVRELKNKLENVLCELSEEKSNAEQAKKDINAMLSVFWEEKNKKKITDTFAPFSKDKLVINSPKWRKLDDWQRILVDKINDKVQVEEKYTADEQNEIAKTIVDELVKDISRMVNDVGEGDITLNTVSDGKAVDNITKRLLGIFEDYVDSIGRRRESERLKKFYSDGAWVLGDFKLDLGLPTGFRKWQEKKDEKAWYQLWDTKYEGQEVRDSIKNSLSEPLKDFFEDCEAKCNEAVLRWGNETVLLDLVATFEEKLELEVTNECKKQDEKIESLEKAVKLAEKLQDDCLQIKKNLEEIKQENE